MATALPRKFSDGFEPDDSPESTDAPEEIRYRKPRADLYTALLAIALAALILGCMMLYMELQFYEFKCQGAPSVSWQRPPVSSPFFCPTLQASTDALPTAQLFSV
jgi:hypothetical protein